MGNLIKHLNVIHKHRKYVKKACFKMGIPIQGLLHDLSKYSLTELGICKYYTGYGSPHEEARRRLGYSPSWIHHKRINKHHWQYWLDDTENGGFIGIKMPYNYIIEMMCDFIGAGKAYNNSTWTVKAPWDYWINSCKGKRIMNETSEYLIEKLLWNMHEAKSEKEFYEWYKGAKTYLKEMYSKSKLEY